MMLPIERLRFFIKQCDPGRPLPAGDALYVPLDEGVPVRGSDDRSCIETLERTVILGEPTDETCQLFTGFPGTGKTTELRRLEARLNEATDVPTRVVYVDAETYLDRYTLPTITDVLRVLAYSLDRAATLAEGKDPDKESGYLKRLFDFLKTEIDFNKVGFGALGASLMLELKNNPSFRERAEAALQLRFQQFATEAHQVMNEAVTRLREAAEVERVVLIADSLEKFTPLGEGARAAMELGVESVFLQHAEFLHLPCHAIYTFPLWLRFRTAELGARYDQEPQVLPMVKITTPKGGIHDDGVAKLAQLIGKRVELAEVFGEDWSQTLRPIIEASGGYPRDLLRMVRELLRRARQFPVSVADAERVIRSLAEDYSRILLGTDLDLLCEVARTHTLPRADAAQLAAFGRLLERWLILAYRNGTEWYDLHPLVRRASLVQERLAEAKDA